jgi:hypothetical protein
MLAELFHALRDEAEKRRKVEVVDIGSHRERLLVHGDEREVVSIDPPLKRPKLTSLTSFVRYVKRHADIEDGAEVFVSFEAVHGLFSADDRREGAALPLGPTKAWLRLVGLVGEWRQFEPRDAVAFLRDVNAPTSVVDAFRRIDFSRSETAAATTHHGRETLGRSVEAEVAGAADIPDAFEIELSILSGSDLRWVQKVPVRVYLDVIGKRVAFRLDEDDMVAASEAHMRFIMSELEDRFGDAEPPVGIFEGEPGPFPIVHREA